MKEIYIFTYEDGTTKELTDTGERISFLNIVTSTSDNLQITNENPIEPILREYRTSKKLSKIEIVIDNNTIEFNKEIDDYFYYYSYDTVLGSMREYIEIRFKLVD